MVLLPVLLRPSTHLCVCLYEARGGEAPWWPRVIRVCPNEGVENLGHTGGVGHESSLEHPLSSVSVPSTCGAHFFLLFAEHLQARRKQLKPPKTPPIFPKIGGLIRKFLRACKRPANSLKFVHLIFLGPEIVEKRCPRYRNFGWCAAALWDFIGGFYLGKFS